MCQRVYEVHILYLNPPNKNGKWSQQGGEEGISARKVNHGPEERSGDREEGERPLRRPVDEPSIYISLKQQQQQQQQQQQHERKVKISIKEEGRRGIDVRRVCVGCACVWRGGGGLG